MTRPNRAAHDAPIAAWRENARRAFSEFLVVPTAIIVGFVLLAVGLYAMERAQVRWLRPVRAALESRLFVDAQATADLLGTIAGSLITVTSITITLLLLALQQTAASLSSEVFDQFLRRRHNQFYFGFFVGLALYALITLATVNAPFNPVLAASLALLLTIVALFLLIVLLYTTINQMRPVEIIEAVHDLTLKARARQRHLLDRTRRAPELLDGTAAPVKCTRHGYVTRIDVESIGTVAARGSGAAEVVLGVAIGSFVATGDLLAHVVVSVPDDAPPLVDAVRRAVTLERRRDIGCDPANGIEELETIAWTSISTAKSNPAPGLLTIRSLRDLLARWAGEPPAGAAGALPVVYVDNVFSRLMAALESLAIVSSESMQHQAFTEVVRAVTASLDRLGPTELARAEDLLRRALSALGDHVLTADLEQALTDCARGLSALGRTETAAEVARAREGLARSVGHLNARSTRTPPASER